MAIYDITRAPRALSGLLAAAFVGALFVSASGVVGPTLTAYADEPVPEKVDEKPSVDAGDVYLGNASNFAKPAEIDADAVYAEIAEYKRILEENLEPGSARYDLLMSAASRKFYKALRAVQKDGGYDLIARSGAVSGVDDVPDVTADVISKL